jgi:hypothetical protein
LGFSSNIAANRFGSTIEHRKDVFTDEKSQSALDVDMEQTTSCRYGCLDSFLTQLKRIDLELVKPSAPLRGQCSIGLGVDHVNPAKPTYLQLRLPTAEAVLHGYVCITAQCISRFNRHHNTMGQDVFGISMPLDTGSTAVEVKAYYQRILAHIPYLVSRDGAGEPCKPYNPVNPPSPPME